MLETVQTIKERMTKLEVLIRDTKSRLPAHSVKPPVMMELLDYEDEYHALQAELKRLESKD